MTFYSKEAQITVINKDGEPDRFQEYSGIAYADSLFFNIFDFDFIAGNPSTALINRGTAVITSSLAQKYFKLKPSEVSQAVGKSVLVNNTVTFVITGVVADPPKNSDLPFTFIGDYADQFATNPYFKNGVDWDEYNSDTNCWITLPGGTTAQSLEDQLPPFLEKYCGKEERRSRNIFFNRSPNCITIHVLRITITGPSAILCSAYSQWSDCFSLSAQVSTSSICRPRRP